MSITLDVSNGNQIQMYQNEEGFIIVQKNRWEAGPWYRIPEHEMVMLLNYYRFVKENNVRCEFINPDGGKPREEYKVSASIYPTYKDWIDVSDKLPELVYDGCSENCLISFADGTVSSAAYNGDPDWMLSVDQPDEEIIAWMPMPLPPYEIWPSLWNPADMTHPPQKGEYVICTDEGFCTTWKYGKKGWKKLWEDAGRIIAWMPLPPPYVKSK